MTLQEKLIAISGYLPHELKMRYDLNGDRKTLRIGYLTGIRYVYDDILIDIDNYGYYPESTNPILFPIACLYKEIRVKSYNNGEPFIPIVELAKVIWEQYKWVLSEDGRFAVSNTGGVYKDFEYQPINEVFNINGNPTIYHLQIFDLLNSWRIDYRGLIEQGESISVLDINPNLYA